MSLFSCGFEAHVQCPREVSMVVVMDGAWKPCRSSFLWFSQKGDQRLKVKSVCPFLAFPVKPFIKLFIVLPPCSQTILYILMPIRSVRLTAGGTEEGGGCVIYSVPNSLKPVEHTNRKGEKYILQPFDEQQGNKFINHHYMPHQTLCQPLHGSYTN